MTTLPPVVPPLPRTDTFERGLPAGAALAWLRAGWRDMTVKPGLSLAYGAAVFLASLVVIGGMFALGWDDVLFPALAGFLIVGPILAIGLYEKSRRLALGEAVTLSSMILVKGGRW